MLNGRNIVLNKSFDFSVRVVNLYKYLSKEKKEYVLSKQLLRSGTSIGANVNEAQAGQSKNDFIANKQGSQRKQILGRFIDKNRLPGSE